MTKAQYAVYNRLAKKQVNRLRDVQIVEESIASVTLYLAFPGIYMTYDSAGRLILTETKATREKTSGRLARDVDSELTFGGELGS